MKLRSHATSCLFLMSLTGCVTPNLLGETSAPVFAVDRFGPQAEAVAIEIQRGETLRGVFVSAGAGAPVVLHFLGAGETLTAPSRVAGRDVWVGETTADLLGLGLSSLVVDYRGVGNSEGERHSRNLPEDVAAIWQEAVRRAGAADRVLVRAFSFGTIASAQLLETGARPAAVVLIAPVRAETVALHWVRAHKSWFSACLAWLILRRPLPVDVAAAMRGVQAPFLLVFGARDELLPPDEQALLRAAAEAAGARVLIRDQMHLPLTRDARRLLPGEREFLTQLEIVRGASGR